MKKILALAALIAALIATTVPARAHHLDGIPCPKTFRGLC